MNPAFFVNNVYSARKGRVKIIVTYASAGSGHLKAAEAVYNYLKEHREGIEVVLVDTLRMTNSLFRLSYSLGYAFLVNYATFLWSFIFWITHLKSLRRFSRAVSLFTGLLNANNFVRFLIKENPDYIISTHFLSSEIAVYLKNKGRIESKVISVVTDFKAHPFWICDGTYRYVVATGLTKESLISEGINEGIIKDLGIPVDTKFLRQYDKGSVCRKLGIEQNKFTVLVVTGSFGIGPIEKIVDLLYKDMQLLVVCAKNKRLYKRLNKKRYPHVLVLGFVDNMEELMSVSDMIITKPGGLTISESLVKELVPIFISPIPGQEIANISILEKYGIGLSIKRIENIKDVVLDYKVHPEKMNNIKNNIRKIKRPFAAEELCNVIC